jgi:two-component system phosphate regulon sensor histidine kinase PhoR
MKRYRTAIFIAVSSVALLIVLLIQLNWIINTAAIKEELFNEKANMVLSRTTEALSADQETCRKIGDCVAMDSSAEPVATIGLNEVHKIDSLFTHYMKFYHFHIDYSFEVIKPYSFSTTNKQGFAANFYPDAPGSYRSKLAELASKNGFELKLIFPEKRQFIMAEVGVPFITSIILIVVVLVLFWRTVLSLTREKKISEHTSDFLNNMTHEFKTPLTNIALAGKMIIKGSDNKQEDKIKHYSAIILEENEKLRLQVEQVLSMTAFERGEVPLQKVELDFHQVVIHAVSAMSLQIESRQGNLQLNLNAGQFVIMGDNTHLTNAMCNLVDNAIKYSREKPELSIETATIGQDLIISVSDKGIGIKKEYQKKVFDKFFRVPTGDVHDVKGFGLGLAYVKKIIELHGGKIELQSEYGKGTIFTITLPNG